MTTDCCSAPGLKQFNHALEDILNSVTAVKDIENILLEDSLDRVLAEDIKSNHILPPWNCSAMDGYALSLASSQLEEPLILVGSSFAGHPYEGKVSQGECIRIMTGAVLPDDCDQVVMQENVTSNEVNGMHFITIDSPSVQWQHVRKAGSEVEVGVKLLSKGQQINPRNIGVIASLGIRTVSVYKRLTIAIFSTGDELVQPGGELQAGQIYDSNRFSVIAVCKRLGYEIIDFGLIEDNYDKIKTVMLEASEKSDVLLTSGGVSVGDADFVKPIVEEIGKINLWKVAIKPGKPIAVGAINKCLFFGLPGNPVSAMVTLNLLVQPAMQKLSGRDIISPEYITAVSDSVLIKKPGRRDYQRGISYKDNTGQWRVKTTGIQGSAKLTSMADANCFIVLDERSSGITVGDNVDIQLFDESIR